MASKERLPMTDKEKIEKLKAIAPTKYENVDLDHLVMHAVGQLDRMGADLSCENAVVAAFRLFPKKFSLPGYPSYPDGKRIHDCLFRCTFKTKKWLGGKTRQGFSITDRSRAFIKEAEDLLSGVPSDRTKAPSHTRRKELLLAEVLSSPAYTKFRDGKYDSISESDACYLLQGTRDSSRDTLRENLLSLKRFVQELEQADLAKFLDWFEKRFETFLSGT
jgi:hypothetical protein